MFDFNIKCSGAPMLAQKAALAAAQSDAMQSSCAQLQAELKETAASERIKEAALARVEDGPGGRITVQAGDLEGLAPHVIYLEYGTAKTPARPWLLPAFARACERLQKVFAGLGRQG